MCGILAIIGKGKSRAQVIEMSSRMAHRGQDESDLYITEKGHVLAHERLSIIDLHSGKQPIQGTNNAWMVHNGEIYNHSALREGVLANHSFRTQSDSEVIVHMYEAFGTDFCHQLDGVFAFVIIDGDFFMAARDPLGVKPLYYGIDDRGKIYFASEMKAIADHCKTFAVFPPGHFYVPEKGFVKYYTPSWENISNANQTPDFYQIRTTLTQAVSKRLMSDVPVGVLLSGGLDSSLIASITSRLMKQKGRTLHSFAIGLNAQSPDIIAAREVAAFLGTKHHEIFYDIEEGKVILNQLIWHLETYDVTSVRASTPMFFLSKAISNQGIKVVLSGEGADEIFGGYLYFKNAPSAIDFQKETVERVHKLYTADLLRADKSTMAHAVEARVPFLDKAFLELAMNIIPQEKMPASYGGVEKYILRKAFDTPDDPYLPDSILWRQKEQFSDGVGYHWIDSLLAYAEESVSDLEFAQAEMYYPYNAPKTKEAFLYRTIFNRHFPQQSAAQTVRKWIPKWQDNLDPSGRANKAHINSGLTSPSEIQKKSV
jgi:asparagine synthase (glutamine-hydrolysing)